MIIIIIETAKNPKTYEMWETKEARWWWPKEDMIMTNVKTSENYSCVISILIGKCLTTCVVYKADVITDDDQQQYTGLTEGTFKQGYYSHQLSLRDKKYSDSTELSKYAWKLKESNKVHNININWYIHQRAAAHTNKSKRCNLCLAEKLAIIRTDKSQFLNKRSEPVSKCRHEINFTSAISR